MLEFTSIEEQGTQFTVLAHDILEILARLQQSSLDFIRVVF
jgi:hypothetical protein